MEGLIFKAFTAIFRLVGILMVTGTAATVIGDIQKRAFDNHRTGLVSMLRINQQLVGKTK